MAAVALAFAGVAPAAAQSLPTGSLGSSGGSPVAPSNPGTPSDPTTLPPTVSTTSVADLRARFTGPGNLVNQSFLAPGMKVYTKKSSTNAYQCTAGFIGSKGGVQYMITAGHCGDPGQDVYIPHPSGTLKTQSGETLTKIGTYERSNSDPYSSGQDWAVVRLTPGVVPVSTAFGGEVEIAGVMSQAEAQRDGTILCLIGSTTGLQCGAPHNSGTTTMLGIEVKAEQGDSGGPVVALRDGKLYAVAVTSVQMKKWLPKNLEYTAAYPVAQVAADNGISL